MSDAQRDFFGFLVAAFGTMVGLFVLQEWYGTFIDVRAHASMSDAGMVPALAAVRDAEAKKLASGRVPIEQAMRGIAERGRTGFKSIAPAPSDDLSAMSGWIHGRHFKPYMPRALPSPEPAAPVAPDAGVTAEEAPK